MNLYKVWKYELGFRKKKQNILYEQNVRFLY